MQWLMRFRILWGIHKSFHNIHPAPSQLCCRSLSEVGAPRWNDYEVPEEFNFASCVLDYWAQMEKEGKRGPNPAFWWVNGQGDEVKWSFREIADLTRRTANIFTQTCGLQQGDLLALILPRVPEWWLVTVGCMRTDQHPQNTPVLSQRPWTQWSSSSPVGPQASRRWQNTVMGWPYNPLSLQVSRKIRSLKTSDVSWCLSDPGWILATMGALVEPWTAGCTAFIHHLPQFDTKVIIQALLKYPINQFFGAPSIFRMILQQDFTSIRFPALEHCCTGGEVLWPKDQEEWKRRTGLPLYDIYGQSETGIICATLREMKIKPGFLGKASPPYDVQVIDDKGNILPPNTEGNIGIRIKPARPVTLFLGYEGNPEKTAEVECGDFFNTGDAGMMDEEGYICFLGRSDDIINASGYRIGPAEVESALMEHPAVAESAVVSSPDPIRGEVVKAFIVLTPQFLSHDKDQLTKELQDHVKSVTAPYKYPRKVEFVPDLPKTITGKIKRKELQKKEMGQM
ncbi:acyl-coenzyme A synthetase ACSM1, mitochondrial isoform X2 [Trachypithecus francoisi]|uniref:acyl-coenzyme A synthetase ACSM1, mitochondrial isoform X2 n=1 Tax=Trachypithecus francoisi TaxID=54180 RepID=UPI00141B1F03|nr:acyl-coenzyme A synthetase ACSM1, mitochondrial isoform X2 [Trachypithecus francoisi]